MYTLLDEIVWKFINALDDITEASEQLYCDLLVAVLTVFLQFSQWLTKLVNLIFDLLRDIIILEIRVGALHDPLK